MHEDVTSNTHVEKDATNEETDRVVNKLVNIFACLMKLLFVVSMNTELQLHGTSASDRLSRYGGELIPSPPSLPPLSSLCALSVNGERWRA